MVAVVGLIATEMVPLDVAVLGSTVPPEADTDEADTKL
jgi:hypothetical protein